MRKSRRNLGAQEESKLIDEGEMKLMTAEVSVVENKARNESNCLNEELTERNGLEVSGRGTDWK